MPKAAAQLREEQAAAASPPGIPLTFLQVQALLSWEDTVAFHQLSIPALKALKAAKACLCPNTRALWNI